MIEMVMVLRESFKISDFVGNLWFLFSFFLVRKRREEQERRDHDLALRLSMVSKCSLANVTELC